MSNIFAWLDCMLMGVRRSVSQLFIYKRAVIVTGHKYREITPTGADIQVLHCSRCGYYSVGVQYEINLEDGGR